MSSSQSERRTRIKSVIAASSGNFLEMYDFMAFGYYAVWIGHAFFPRNSEFASLMLSLGTFGAGFLMRPVGALVLGSYLDHHGRRKGLLLTLALMGIGTLSIACMPTYAAIGLLAPLLVVLGRLLQGLSAGVEVGGVSVYLSEIATPGHKGFYVSWQSGSQQMAVSFASLIGISLGMLIRPEQMSGWGWRIPFLIGCLLIPFLFVVRSTLPETPFFLARTHRPSTSAILYSIAGNWRIVGLGMLLATTTTVTFYMITAYTPTYGASVLHLSPRDSLTVSLCVGISNFIFLPIMGAISDRVGRRPLLFCCSLMLLLLSYPMLSWLVVAPSFSRLLAVELALSVLYAGYNGAMIVFLTEIIPADVRTSGFSLAYSLATAVFGGFTPAICSYLIHVTQNRAIPGLWLSAGALCGLAATFLLSPRRLSYISRNPVSVQQSLEVSA